MKSDFTGSATTQESRVHEQCAASEFSRVYHIASSTRKSGQVSNVSREDIVICPFQKARAQNSRVDRVL